MLREVRLRLARERGVPPYVIFHDTTLRDMVERRPKTIDDLHEIYGVGAKKAADFGDAFLDAIRTFRRPDVTNLTAENAEYAEKNDFCASQRSLRLIVSSVNGVGLVQREGRDLDVEVVAVLGDHLVGAAHHAGRGLQRAARGVLERLARTQHRLLADDARALDFLDVAGRVA